MKQWLKLIIDAPQKKGLPILSFPCTSLMGISVKELINSSDLQAKGMKSVAQHVDSAAVVSFMDLSVEAECFGAEICFTDNEVPTVVGSIISSYEEAEHLSIPAVGTARSHIYVEALGKAVKLIDDRPVLAGCIGPFSLAGRLMDVSQIMMDCYEEPEKVHLVLQKTTMFIKEYALAFKNVGANGIVIAEPLAGLLSPDFVEEFSSFYMKEIIEAVQDDDFLVVYHNCGNNTPRIIESLSKMGAGAWHFGNAIDMSKVMPLVPSHILVMGNIDPAGEFAHGTVASIMRATESLLTQCASYPNFMISSGCDIPPHARWENIEAFFAAIHNFYQENVPDLFGATGGEDFSNFTCKK